MVIDEVGAAGCLMLRGCPLAKCYLLSLNISPRQAFFSRTKFRRSTALEGLSFCRTVSCELRYVACLLACRRCEGCVPDEPEPNESGSQFWSAPSKSIARQKGPPTDPSRHRFPICKGGPLRGRDHTQLCLDAKPDYF